MKIRMHVILAGCLLAAGTMVVSAQAAVSDLSPLPVQQQWVAVGDIAIAGERYTKLLPADERSTMRVLPAPVAEQGVFAGDRLLLAGSGQGPSKVSGAIVIRLEVGVNAAQLAQDSQLELVFSHGDMVLLKALDGQDLLPVIETLEHDDRVRQVQLELVGNLNRPQ
ncbi:hypothetical protein ABT56_20535 [Photobacterium aquae]|uniref:ASP external chaperone domain-containing protein n=1 Tax=Photobacterium aquae TaxID=1195763 RepID=A0A0J1JM29_9GAMM|nr:hypothetical protein [Photobacterium aquae]KLV03207.1 hypothetical protein ABT56_20535 [Photobacterium aquae]